MRLYEKGAAGCRPWWNRERHITRRTALSKATGNGHQCSLAPSI
jgi:hypothetical protein